MDSSEIKYLNHNSKCVVSRQYHIDFIKRFIKERINHDENIINKNWKYAGVIDLFGNMGCGKSEFVSQLPILLDLPVGSVVSMFTYNHGMEVVSEESKFFRILYGGLSYMPVLYKGILPDGQLCKNLSEFSRAIDEFV